MNNQSPIYCENGLQYTLNEEGAFIYRYEGDDEKLVIPDTLGGKPVIGLLARSLANTKATPNPYIREIDYKSINRNTRIFLPWLPRAEAHPTAKADQRYRCLFFL